MKVIIVGAFHEIIELAELCDADIVGIIDNKEHSVYCGYPILGTDNEVEVIHAKYPDCKIVITPDSPQAKSKIVSLYSKYGFEFATLISPKAIVSKSAVIGKGVIVQGGVNISSNVIIGDFVKINFMANIMHDAKIGNYCIIAPSSVILGRAQIGDSCYIGAHSTINADIIIDSYSTIKPASII